MSEPELKPCPFCGGKAFDWTWKKPFEPIGQSWIAGEATAKIICRPCRAQSREVCIDCGPKDATDADVKEALKQAVEAWNTRTIPEPDIWVDAYGPKQTRCTHCKMVADLSKCDLAAGRYCSKCIDWFGAKPVASDEATETREVK